MARAAGPLGSRAPALASRTGGWDPPRVTINHAPSVLSRFCDCLGELAEGPVVKPVPRAHTERRRYAHHSPDEPYGAQRRAHYRQRVRDLPPMALLRDVVKDLLQEMACHRDRAVLPIFLSAGAGALTWSA
jgi:hypothetical protein